MPNWHHDRPAQFFGAAALLTLCVSIPATYALLRPFHDSGEWIGLALTAFAMLVFEVGAVGAKLITIAIPQWRWQMTALTVVLLVLTSVGNYLHGAELFRAATLPPTLAELRTAGASPWLVGGAAALFPALLFVWLVAFVARVEGLGQLASREQELAELAEQLELDAACLADRDRDLTAREAELATRTRVETVEYIRVASAELSWSRLMGIIDKARQEETISLSTVRRLVTRED